MLLTTDFTCKECGATETTTRLALSDPIRDPLWCNACGGVEFKRIFQPPSVIFRGGGWASKS